MTKMNDLETQLIEKGQQISQAEVGARSDSAERAAAV